MLGYGRFHFVCYQKIAPSVKLTQGRVLSINSLPALWFLRSQPVLLPKPIHSDNPMVVNISSAVRTLVVGVVALGMGIFGLVAIGLFALMVQLLIQGSKKGQSTGN